MIDELAEMAPGPRLSAALARIDLTVLNGHAAVIVMCARARQLAYEQAQLLDAVWTVVHCPPGGPDAPVRRSSRVSGFAVDEVRFALNLTRAGADSQVSLAYELVDRLPAVHAALRAGQLDLHRARIVADQTGSLAQEQARQVAAQVLPLAGEWTSGQLRARLRRLVLAFDPQTADTRMRRGIEQRGVQLRADEDGTATLTAYGLPADRAAAAMARLTATAKTAKAHGDPRSMDQLRADTLLDLLDPSAHGAPSTMAGSVELVVPLTTLMGLSEQPGDLGGFGPVVADLARQMAERSVKARWRFSVVDPDTGHLVHHGTTRRRPTTEDADFVRARDRTCRAPGCRVPARHADLDHTVDHATGGPSHVDNLGPLCRHDHRAKHEGHFTLRQTTSGVFQWTTPLGHTYTVTPPDLRNGPSG